MVCEGFDDERMGVWVREEVNVLIEMGNINKKRREFLLGDLDGEGIVIGIGKGRGVMEVIDSECGYEVLGLLCGS